MSLHIFHRVPPRYGEIDSIAFLALMLAHRTDYKRQQRLIQRAMSINPTNRKGT